MKRIISVSYNDLNVEVIKEASPDILKVIKDDIDFYFLIKLKEENTNAVVFSNGAYDPQKSEPPIFMRSRFAASYNANCIFIDDVSIHNTNLRIGWGIGSPEKHYLAEYSDIVKIILDLLGIDDESTVYFGSSAGGFMSMGLSIMHEGSKAVVNNPQFYATTYAKGISLKKVFIEHFDGMERKEILTAFPERFSITSMMRKYNHFPEILVIQNRLHTPDIQDQFEPFIKTCEKYKLKMENIEFLFYHSHNGHDPIENEKAARLVNAHFIKRKKKILIVLHSLSEHNGLHDNVYQTAIEARSRGFKVYIAHKKGEFLTRVYREGFDVINCNISETRKTIDKIKESVGDDLDLIHVHPGESRKVGLFLKRELNVPLVMTIHGKWTDNIGQYIEQVDAVLAVSQGIKEKIVDECDNIDEKVHVIPNYSKYSNMQVTDTDESEKLTVAFISRLDKDKELIINEVKKLVPVLNNYKGLLQFNIIGDGTIKEDLQNYFKSNITNKNINVNFVGWIHNDKELLFHYSESDLVIGPGRVIIDAFTLNKPAIVIGSKLYEGVITQSNWRKFVDSNFGGYRHAENAEDNDIVHDFEKLINSAELRKETREIGNKVVNEFFDEQTINNKLFGIYDLMIEEYNG